MKGKAMTTENTTDAAELDRLREHNKQLLAELKTERTATRPLRTHCRPPKALKALGAHAGMNLLF